MTRRQQTRGIRVQGAVRVPPEIEPRTAVQRPRNELDHNGDAADWSIDGIVESMIGTKKGQRGTITRATRCTVDVRWPGNIVSTKPKSSCSVVTEEVLSMRAVVTAAEEDGTETESFALAAFPVLAQLMTKGAIASGVTMEEFDDLLESLRVQFEHANLRGTVNVQRGVRERNEIVWDSDRD
jgi:hypothetical protein